MKVQKISPYKVTFGIKVPTKNVIDLVSGMRSEEATDVFLKLTGISNEKTLAKMNTSLIEASKNYCAEKIVELKPELEKLAQIKQEITTFLQSSNDTHGGKLRRMTELYNARESEKAKLLKNMTPEIDIPKIKLSTLSV